MPLKKQLHTNYFYIVLIVLLMSVVGLGLGYSLSRKSSKDTNVAQSSCPKDEVCIRLNGKTADPEIVTVKAGTFVRFNSADGGKHSIALEHAAVQHQDDSSYHSGEFAKDEAFRVQFKKDGNYTFRDELHPEITINIIVYTAGKDYKIKT